MDVEKEDRRRRRRDLSILLLYCFIPARFRDTQNDTACLLPNRSANNIPVAVRAPFAVRGKVGAIPFPIIRRSSLPRERI